MSNEFWLNLPVRNVKKSKEFFAALGFSFHPRHVNSDEMASLQIGDNKTIIMLFDEKTFQGFTNNAIADTSKGTEALLSIEVESKEKVDEIVEKAVLAGGKKYCEPNDQGWMYGSGFIDLDGHRWNLLYMDKSKIPD